MENPVLRDKAQRLKWLISIMEKRKREKFAVLTALLEINFGVSKEKAKEYIQTCIVAGCLKRDDNSEIVFVKSDYGV